MNASILVVGACLAAALVSLPTAAAHTYVSLNLEQGCASGVFGPGGTHLVGVHAGTVSPPVCVNVVVDYADPIPEVILVP